jgi:hypothetical protein
MSKTFVILTTHNRQKPSELTWLGTVYKLCLVTTFSNMAADSPLSVGHFWYVFRTDFKSSRANFETFVNVSATLATFGDEANQDS